MSSKDICRKLITTLEGELSLIQEYNAGCESLHKQIVARDWTLLEAILQNLRSKAEELSLLDENRDALILDLKEASGISGSSSFGLLMTCLDQQSQDEIKVLKQKIRHAIRILQARIKGIGNYTDNQTNALKDVMDILIPDQKGQIYNKKGAKSYTDSKPLLFNHQF